MLRGVLGLVLLLLTSGRGIAEILRSLGELSFDGENHLSSHYLLYSESCAAELVSPDDFSLPHRPALAASHQVMQELHALSDSCSLVCLQRGVPSHLVHHVLPHHVLREPESSASALDWVYQKCDAVELGIVNNLDHVVNLYWIGPEGRHPVGSVSTGGEKEMTWLEVRTAP